MFSVIFPGQGSQSVGMAKDLYNRFSIVKNIFKRADDVLKFPISKIIFDGPETELNLTKNTQPAIFIVSYSIFSIIKSEFNINLNTAKYFAGHSLGEYSALACSNAIKFEDTIKLLNKRGISMQDAVPIGEGAMLAVLGKEVENVEKILIDKNLKDCQIANDNCPGQLVVSGKTKSIDELNKILKKISVKSIKLPVSAPFHCSLMEKSTKIMNNEINNTQFNNPLPNIISNVTATEQKDKNTIKKLLIEQIENRVRWKESITYMISNGVRKFIEIGPGKVLTGLVKRIDKTVETLSINNEDDIKKIKIND